ncbi:hypothetical protein BH11BAC6_BH11BAC6_10550 [soil metagenome]
MAVRGGYILRLPPKSVCSNKMNERCAPHKGQSIPKIDLYAQGNM